MAWDWSIVQSLISAASGLGGVYLGAWLTGRRDADKEAIRVTKEASYLAILVVAHLDRLADGCVDVAFDDGTSEGRPAGTDGVYHEITVSPPTFDPLALNVDWKVLPADLMHSILGLPYRIEQLSHHISGVGEYDDPPDFCNFFWARQHGYAVLGLAVCEIANRLRRHAGVASEKPIDGEWNREERLRELRDRIAKERDEYHERQKRSLPRLEA